MLGVGAIVDHVLRNGDLTIFNDVNGDILAKCFRNFKGYKVKFYISIGGGPSAVGTLYLFKAT